MGMGKYCRLVKSIIEKRIMSKKQKHKLESILTQWKICVEMANSISQRRDTMNNIFVTLNLSIVTAASFAWNLKSIPLLVAGIAICILWISFIRNYKFLNDAKFSVINELEENLPYKPFLKEWNELKESKKYKEGTTLELWLPSIFIALYIIVPVLFIVYYIIKFAISNIYVVVINMLTNSIIM